MGCGRQGTKNGKCDKCHFLDDAESRSDEGEHFEDRLQTDASTESSREVQYREDIDADKLIAVPDMDEESAWCAQGEAAGKEALECSEE